MQLISRISEIENNYCAFILDIWGVLWDGIEPYEMAISSLKELRKKRKPVILLSNAPRRAKTVENKLKNIGINKDYYNKIISSGEICRNNFLKNNAYISKIGNIFYFVGQEEDKEIAENLPLIEKKNINESNFLLVCGTRNFEDDLDKYKFELDQGIELKLPLVCANPDKVVVRKNGNKLICAGELAYYYYLKGGTVFYFGKPYPDVYNECIQSFRKLDANISEKDILVIGDSLETDIKGACKNNLSSVLVAGGIHAELFSKNLNNNSIKKIQKLCKKKSEYPDFLINKFIF